MLQLVIVRFLQRETLATQALILDFDLAKHILHIRGLTRSKIISGVSYQANYLSADTAV